MKRIEIDLEAVTATFLHVEPDGAAAWRAAPFRGLARWWFRAVKGAALGGDSAALRKEEEGTFGTATSPSPVVFRILHAKGDQEGFPLNPGAGSRGRQAWTKALRPGASATLEIALTPWSEDPERLRQAYAAVWLALHLGGVGQRARRGGGSLKIAELRIAEVADAEALPRPVRATELDAHARELAAGIEAAQRILGTPRRIASPSFPILHPEHSWVAVSKGPAGDESAVRTHLMGRRRTAPGHRGGAKEIEFGGIRPRLSSPTWVRIAPGNLFVSTVFRYETPSGPASWSNAEAFVRSLGEGRDVFGKRAS